MSEKGERELKFSPDLVSSIFFILFSLFFLFKMDSEVYVADDTLLNARTFPFIVLSIILILSIILLIKEIFLIVRKEERHFVTIKLKDEAYSLLVFLTLLLYAASTALIGFTISSLIFPAILCFIMGSRKASHFIIVEIFSFSIAIIFRYFLGVRF